MGTAYELCQLNCEFDPALSLHYNALAARQGMCSWSVGVAQFVAV